jgi:RNA polymerase sigma-70 factor (ECF subfamily)
MGATQGEYSADFLTGKKTPIFSNRFVGGMEFPVGRQFPWGHPAAIIAIPNFKRTSMGGTDREDFVVQLIAIQSRLYAFIMSLLLDRERAQDVLQQTNLVLLKKQNEYEPGTNFGAWACKVARYEVLAYRRTRQRDRHSFNDELLGLIAQRAEIGTEDIDQRAVALELCLERLTADQRKLLEVRYRQGGSVDEIARAAKKTPTAISSLLYRIRSALAECVRRRMEESTR